MTHVVMIDRRKGSVSRVLEQLDLGEIVDVSPHLGMDAHLDEFLGFLHGHLGFRGGRACFWVHHHSTSTSEKEADRVMTFLARQLAPGDGGGRQIVPVCFVTVGGAGLWFPPRQVSEDDASVVGIFLGIPLSILADPGRQKERKKVEQFLGRGLFDILGEANQKGGGKERGAGSARAAEAGPGAEAIRLLDEKVADEMVRRILNVDFTEGRRILALAVKRRLRDQRGGPGRRLVRFLRQHSAWETTPDDGGFVPEKLRDPHVGSDVVGRLEEWYRALEGQVKAFAGQAGLDADEQLFVLGALEEARERAILEVRRPGAGDSAAGGAGEGR